MSKNKKEENLQVEKNIVNLLHNVVTASFCYNTNDESLKEKNNVTRTRSTD